MTYFRETLSLSWFQSSSPLLERTPHPMLSFRPQRWLRGVGELKPFSDLTRLWLEVGEGRDLTSGRTNVLDPDLTDYVSYLRVSFGFLVPRVSKLEYSWLFEGVKGPERHPFRSLLLFLSVSGTLTLLVLRSRLEKVSPWVLSLPF